MKVLRTSYFLALDHVGGLACTTVLDTQCFKELGAEAVSIGKAYIFISCTSYLLAAQSGSPHALGRLLDKRLSSSWCSCKCTLGALGMKVGSLDA